MANPLSITHILNDKGHLHYFNQFLKLNNRRFITLYNEIRKFRANVQGSEASEALSKCDDNSDDIRDQLMCLALNNVTEITKDSVNVTQRTAEEMNAEGQRIIRSYSDVLQGDSVCVVHLRQKLDSGKVSDNEFAAIELYVETFLATRITDFISSAQYKALMVVAFSDASLSLDQILSFQDSALVFMDFMKNENSEDVLLFYLESCEFRKDFDKLSPAERDENAQKMFKKLEVIGFSSTVCDEAKLELQTISHDIFKLPIRQAITTLKTVYLPLFLRSSYFRIFLSELVEQAGLTKLEEDNLFQTKPDDASSLSGSQSTCGIDLGVAFSRPELIYYRPLSGHLYLGHIDSLGRYRSETLQTGRIQKILEAKEREKKKYTFSRFLGSSKIVDEKAEEEAWKTARMIIADITSFKL